MAHRLSSSLYDDGNKMSKGQEMYLKRAKKSGKWIHQSARFGGVMLPGNYVIEINTLIT